MWLRFRLVVALTRDAVSHHKKTDRQTDTQSAIRTCTAALLTHGPRDKALPHEATTFLVLSYLSYLFGLFCCFLVLFFLGICSFNHELEKIFAPFLGSNRGDGGKEKRRCASIHSVFILSGRERGLGTWEQRLPGAVSESVMGM